VPPGLGMCWRQLTTRVLLGRRSRADRCVKQCGQGGKGANQEGRHEGSVGNVTAFGSYSPKVLAR
jgi:hypothetical protein